MVTATKENVAPYDLPITTLSTTHKDRQTIHDYGKITGEPFLTDSKLHFGGLPSRLIKYTNASADATTETVVNNGIRVIVDFTSSVVLSPGSTIQVLLPGVFNADGE